MVASATSLDIFLLRPAQLRKLDLIPCGTAGEPTLWSKSDRALARMYSVLLWGRKIRPSVQPVRSWTEIKRSIA